MASLDLLDSLTTENLEKIRSAIVSVQNATSSKPAGEDQDTLRSLDQMTVRLLGQPLPIAASVLVRALSAASLVLYESRSPSLPSLDFALS